MYQILVPFIFSIIIMIIFLQPMWNSSIEFSKDQVSYIKIYELGTKWLSENLEKNESAIVPLGSIFWAMDPSLKNHTKTYSEFWKEGKVDVIHATEEEREKMRDLFWKYVLDNDENVKFIVTTWNDKHMKSTLEMHPILMRNINFCENINNSLSEIKRFRLELPSSDWYSFLIICNVNIVDTNSIKN